MLGRHPYPYFAMALLLAFWAVLGTAGAVFEALAWLGAAAWYLSGLLLIRRGHG